MTLKVAIIGTGLIGPRHAQSVLSNSSTTLVALIDPVSENAKPLAEQFQTAYYPSIASLLSSDAVPKPDAAIICTPNHTHVVISLELLSNNIHVLVEKPVSNDIETGRGLLEFLRRPENAHLKLLVGHHRRFNPYVQKTKQILDGGSLGRIIAINGLWMLYKPDSYFLDGGEWRSNQESGGVVSINLVHDIDVLHFLFGPIVRVHAEKTAPQRANPPHAADEGAAITLRFASGVVGTFLVCDAAPSPHNFETGTGENPRIPASPTGNADFYQIFGSEASLSVPDMMRWSYDGRSAKSWSERLAVETFDVEREVAPFDLQLGHFVDVIGGLAGVSCSGAEGLRALVVCQAVRAAIKSGMPVDVDVGLE